MKVEDKFFEESEEMAELLMPLIPWIKEQIYSSQGEILSIEIIDIKKKLGPKFEKIDQAKFYDLIKFVLFHEAIATDEKDDTLIMKMASIEYSLPPHLAIYLEPIEEDEEKIENIEMTKEDVKNIINYVEYLEEIAQQAGYKLEEHYPEESYNKLLGVLK